ncbi:heterokaryon incompatibility protein-domain-containing protein [Scleroderma yunnanense]
MRLINVRAFLEREELIGKKMRVDRRTKVLQFRDDEATAYAILSHRWTNQEVDYGEMVDLAKMDRDESDEIRQRDGYRKILDSCKKAEEDGYEWLWVDTCCIDKRSSAELSEAINSMYRWYANARVCYAYLHDVSRGCFPTNSDDEEYPDFDGWPEWFSRGWTLQEMIAPSNVQFFNKDWWPIGDKRTLAPTLSIITRVPEDILTNGLSSNRPCVAQIMSWAADRTTTRVEDRAYSLLGLLDVNMPMLYGEGKKAFHRLQLEIIRVSNDQSIFAWGPYGRNPRAGSILADDPSFFRGCEEVEQMDHNEFIQYHKDNIPSEELPSVDEDRFGTFPITNRGIHIWMFLHPLDGSNSVFDAWLPCRYSSTSPPVRITLVLWNSNYYRYFTLPCPTEQTLKFRQVYLRYQDTQHNSATFEIDDSAITKDSGFTYLSTYPSKFTGNTFTLTGTDPLCVKIYSDSESLFAKPTSENSWEGYLISGYYNMLFRGPEHAQSTPLIRGSDGVWFKHTSLLGSTRTVQTSCAMWESSSKCGVKFEVSRHSNYGPDKWTNIYVEGTNDSSCDIWGLMIPYSPRSAFLNRYALFVDGTTMEFSMDPNGVELGDYGYLTDSDEFRPEGNIFADLRCLALELDILPRRHKIELEHEDISGGIEVEACGSVYRDVITLYNPIGLSLPNDPGFNSLLASLSARLTNKYLVTTVIQCDPHSFGQFHVHLTISYPVIVGLASPPPQYSSVPRPLYIIAKPFVWYHDEDQSPSVQPPIAPSRPQQGPLPNTPGELSEPGASQHQQTMPRSL